MFECSRYDAASNNFARVLSKVADGEPPFEVSGLMHERSIRGFAEGFNVLRLCSCDQFVEQELHVRMCRDWLAEKSNHFESRSAL